MTLGEWLTAARHRVTPLEAQVLAAHALLTDRAWILAHPEAEIPDLALEVLLQRMEAGEPLAYITGHREFYGLDFEVTPAVLIPRQETETLVEAVLSSVTSGSVLDIGTGSGCVAIALKHALPLLTMTSADVSPAAIEVARRNAARLGVEVEFVLADGIEVFEAGAFDLVVSNPPYVALGDELGPGVGEYEPHLALYSGPTGLEFYERLARARPGRLFVEVGDTQASAVCGVFDAAGMQVVRTYRDLMGIERVVEAVTL